MTANTSGSAPASGASPRPCRIALATSNSGKLREITAMLDGAATIIPLSALAISLPDETGTTFEENALGKARFVAAETGLLTIADDSGLEVDALNGAPGVYSARYTGPNATDARNRELLLERMRDVPLSGRAARFVCVLAIADPSGAIRTVTGSCAGRISDRAIGSEGFGYDPVFQLEDGQTMAQISQARKNEISHRGIALRLALPILLAALRGGMLQPERFPEPGGSDDSLDVGTRIE